MTPDQIVEHSPDFLALAEREGAICGQLRSEGVRAYTRKAPEHFGPNRADAWLRGYDKALLAAVAP